MADLNIKQTVLDSLEQLPQDASMEDIMEKILLIHKIEKGIEQADRGELIDHEEVLNKIRKW
ncbi:MAG TPA: hypothetical protein DEQ34_10905 [Balneolaceae bacterium]|nr:hypothetical protein [Balneolaceae bacterium]|tara:strand:+ start:72904 stop:73089 length:186 start_codon:yes stop_codon:yes gene_type:complete